MEILSFFGWEFWIFWTGMQIYSCLMASKAEMRMARLAGITPDRSPIKVENRMAAPASHKGMTDTGREEESPPIPMLPIMNIPPIPPEFPPKPLKENWK